jgi:hypothetical protein
MEKDHATQPISPVRYEKTNAHDHFMKPVEFAGITRLYGAMLQRVASQRGILDGAQCNESLVWKSVDVDQYRFDSNHSGASCWPQP